MLSRRSVPALAVLASTPLLIAGCGGSKPAASAGQVQTIATSPGTTPGGSATAIDGSFRTIVPAGFRYTKPTKAPAGGTDVEYAATTGNTGAFQTVTVTRQALAGKSAGTAVTSYVSAIAHSAGVSQATPLAKTAAPAPSGAQSWRFQSAPKGVPPEIIEQTFFSHGGALYTVLATAPAGHVAALEKSAASVLAAWHWV